MIIYADAHIRRLSDSEIKHKNSCLKQIEQAIFKQSRTIDSVLLEFPHDYHQCAEAKFSQVKKIRLQAINDLLGGGQILKSSEE